MNIKFTNNSVSGLNRRYRGFDFELPGSTSKTMDVPEQYVENLTTYLKEKHPAVICEKVEVEKTDAPPVADADSAPANTGGSESGTGQKEKEAAGPGNANSSGNKNKKGGGNKK